VYWPSRLPSTRRKEWRRLRSSNENSSSSLSFSWSRFFDSICPSSSHAWKCHIFVTNDNNAIFPLSLTHNILHHQYIVQSVTQWANTSKPELCMKSTPFLIFMEGVSESSTSFFFSFCCFIFSLRMELNVTTFSGFSFPVRADSSSIFLWDVIICIWKKNELQMSHCSVSCVVALQIITHFPILLKKRL